MFQCWHVTDYVPPLSSCSQRASLPADSVHLVALIWSPDGITEGTCAKSAVLELSRPAHNVLQNIIAKDGIVNGLLIRGLGTKILANGCQGMMRSPKPFDTLLIYNGL